MTNKNIHRLSLEILKTEEDHCFGIIKKDNTSADFKYYYQNRNVEFHSESKFLKTFLQKNIFQIRGILQSKRPDTFYSGFSLDFSIDDNFFEPEPEGHICVIDRTTEEEKRYFTLTGTPSITEVYCDGCFLPKRQCGGIAVLVKYPDQRHELIQEKITPSSSNEAELLAAIKALEVTRHLNKIRLISDSRYIRKGLSKWLIHWKLNNWRTSNGESPKNIDLWQYIDQLTDKRFIEFSWVKGHYHCQENIICDRHARSIAIST